MTGHSIGDDYFEWLVDIICGERFGRHVSFRKLLSQLHNIEFRYFIQGDKNRASDGMNLRYRFAISVYKDVDERIVLDNLSGPCSVLEMMVALAIRCEEDIMDDPAMGDRTGQWFWKMIVNLGLGSMTDDRYDRDKVDQIIDRFIYREYDSDGKGGLFTVRNCKRNLRESEIWWQMCWYLDTIT